MPMSCVQEQATNVKILAVTLTQHTDVTVQVVGGESVMTITISRIATSRHYPQTL